MMQPAPVVFLLDVDNALLDNDQITEDLKRHLAQAFGAERQGRYWAIFEKLREELGYTDYLGALQQYRFENRMIRASWKCPSTFWTTLSPSHIPGSLEVIARLHAWGQTVIVSMAMRSSNRGRSSVQASMTLSMAAC